MFGIEIPDVLRDEEKFAQFIIHGRSVARNLAAAGSALTEGAKALDNILESVEALNGILRRKAG